MARDYVPGIGGGPGEIGGHAFSSLGSLEVSVLVLGNDHDPFTQHGGIDLRSRFRHSADAFGTEREWEGRPERIHATNEQKVRGIEWRRIHKSLERNRNSYAERLRKILRVLYPVLYFGIIVLTAMVFLGTMTVPRI